MGDKIVIGKKLDGRYEITELIGEGGMSDVYKAKDLENNRIVAVKILKKEFANNEEFLKRFRNESRAISVLSHPNIVKVYDLGFTEKIQYIVMEFIDGITLTSFMEKQKKLPWKTVVHLSIQVLRALGDAHKNGIIHRDIKPQNIMMFKDGSIKVMDFGIAKFVSEDGITASNQTIGTVHYISPEQAGGQRTDGRGDIYSLGVVMYEMLTGVKPFDQGATPVSIALMHIQQTPETPRSINPEIPPALETIVMKAMEKSVEDRFSNAEEMIEALEKFKENPEKEIVFGKAAPKEEQPVNVKKVSQVPVGVGYGAETYGRNAGAVDNNYQNNNNDYDEYYDDNYQDGNYYDDGYENDDYYDDGGYDDYDGYEDEEEVIEEKSLFVPILTAVTIVVIIVAVFFIASLIKGVFDTGSLDDTKEFAMIDLVGMNYNDVIENYPQLDINISGSSYSDYEADCIIEQSILAGTPVKKGTLVDVKISKGAEMRKVPNVMNMDASTAQTALEQDGFIAELKYQTDEEIEENYVIKTEPEAKTELAPGSKVIVYISKGPFITTVIVPDLVGMMEEDAKAKCSYSQLQWETVERDSAEPAGTVIAQSLEPDTKVDSDSKIVLTISNGNAPASDVPISFAIPDDASGIFKITLYVEGVPVQEKTDINAAYAGSVTLTLSGTDSQVVVAELTNLSNGLTAVMAKYNINFKDKTIEAISEKIRPAFEAVDGIAAATEAVTTPIATSVTTQPPVTNPPETQPPVVTEASTVAMPDTPDVQQ